MNIITLGKTYGFHEKYCSLWLSYVYEKIHGYFLLISIFNPFVKLQSLWQVLAS
jgi:hypothetical protein